MKKALFTFALLLCLTVALTGCTDDASRLEIKNRLIIQGVGIDKTEAGLLSVSVQALNTDTSGSSSSAEGSREVVKHYTVTGKSISEAISTLSDMTGYEPLLSQNRIVVFGREFAQNGISEQLDDFIRSTENRATVYIALADEKAQDIIFADFGENIIPARRAEQIIKSSQFNSNVVSTRIYELINMLSDDSSAAVLPILRCVSEEKNDIIEAFSTAIIKQDSLSSEKDEDVATGILWINGKIDKGSFSFDTKDGVNVTARIIKSKTRVSSKTVDGKPEFDIKIKCRLDISEINRSVLDIMDGTDIEEIRTCAAQAVKLYVENSINECIIKERADVFGFGRRLKREHPSFYKSNVPSWDGIMSACRYNTEVFVEIERLGGSAARLHR